MKVHRPKKRAHIDIECEEEKGKKNKKNKTKDENDNVAIDIDNIPDDVNKTILNAVFNVIDETDGTELYPEVCRAPGEVEEDGEEESLLNFTTVKEKRKSQSLPYPTSPVPSSALGTDLSDNTGLSEAPLSDAPGCLPYVSYQEMVQNEVFQNMRRDLLRLAKKEPLEIAFLKEQEVLQSKQTGDTSPGVHQGSQNLDFYSQYLDYEVREDGKGADVQLFGVTALGNSITVIVEGVLPHFVVKIPKCWRIVHRDGSLGEVEEWKVERFYEALKKRYASRQNYRIQCITEKLHNQGESAMTDSDIRYAKQYNIYKDNWIRDYELVSGRSYLYYTPDPSPFMKIYTAYPFLVGELKTLIEQCLGGEFEKPYWAFEEKKLKGKVKKIKVRKYKTQEVRRWLPPELGEELPQPFEANIGFVERFSVDSGIYPCTWYRLPARQYQVIPTWHDWRKASTTIEVRVHYKNVKTTQEINTNGIEEELEPAKDVLPRCLEICFDIEAVPPLDGRFPSAKRDPIINIGCVSRLSDSKDVRIVDIFTWGSLPEPKNLDPTRQKILRVHPVRQERDLILYWILFIVRADPDRIYSYNGERFDIPYLYKRAQALGLLAEFQKLGRLLHRACFLRKTTFVSRGTGFRVSHFMKIYGRVQCDVYVKALMKKLRGYSLNVVAAAFLNGEQKEEMGYANIRPCFMTPEGRKKLADYVQKDAYLPLDIADVFTMCLELHSFSCVVGAQPESLMQRGQVYRIFLMLHRETKRLDKEMGIMFIPNTQSRGSSAGTEIITRDSKYKGATVVEPRCDNYEKKNPIATLDFSSLYPSIMMAYNLCYSTLLRNSTPIAIDELRLVPAKAGTNRPYVHIPDFVEKDKEGRVVEVIQNNQNPAFVDHRVQKGVLPLVLQQLNAARSIEKKRMNEETDPIKKEVANSKQLALKGTANSGYGAVGDEKGLLGNLAGLLPCHKQVIAAVVTKTGRGMILLTRAHVLNRYNMYRAQVVYGDTDSVFVRLQHNGLSVDEQIQIFARMAESINEDICHETDPDTGERVQWGPMGIVFEKAYFGLLLLAKKRYIGMKALPKFDRETKKWIMDKPKLEGTGMETERRDNAPFVPEVLSNIIYFILEKDNMPAALAYLRKEIMRLVRQKEIPYYKFIITRKLSRPTETYKVIQPHVSLVRRIAAIDPAAAPKPGDGRIPYVMVDRHSKCKSDGSEIPWKAWQENMQLDMDYYINNQLKSGVKRILGPIIGIPSINKLFVDAIRDAGGLHHANSGIEKLSNTWSAFSKKYRCVVSNCKNYVSKKYAICDGCAPDKSEQERNRAFLLLQKYEIERALSINHCNQVCLKQERQKEITCMAMDCPKFWERQLNMRNLQEAKNQWLTIQKTAERYSILSHVSLQPKLKQELEKQTQNVETTLALPETTSNNNSSSTISLSPELEQEYSVPKRQKKQCTLSDFWRK